MGRIQLSALIWALAITSHAVLDFQFQRRYQTPGFSPQWLKWVAPRVGGGYYVVGQQNDDLVLMRFRPDHTLLGAKTWDAPTGSDFARRIIPNSDGGLTVLFQEHVAKFSSSLTSEWERYVGEASWLYAITKQGTCLIAEGNTYKSLDRNGQLLATRAGVQWDTSTMAFTSSPTHADRFLAFDRESVPTAVIELDSTLQEVSRHAFAVGGSVSMASDQHGAVVFGRTSSGLRVGTLSATSTFEQSEHLASQPTWISLTSDRITGSSGNSIDTFNRQTRQPIIHIRTTAIISADSPSTNEIVAYEQGRTDIYDRNSGMLLRSSANDIDVSFAATCGTTPVAVGNIEISPRNNGRVTTYNGGFTSNTFMVSGPVSRSFVASHRMEGDDVAMLLNEPHRVSSLLLRYRTNGSLALSKALFPSKTGSTATHLAPASDGSIAIAAATNPGITTLTHVDSAGNISFERDLPPFLEPISLVRLQDGATVVFGKKNSVLQVLRISPGGNLIYWRSYADTSAQAGCATVLPDGRLVFSNSRLMTFAPQTGARISSTFVSNNGTQTLEMRSAYLYTVSKFTLQRRLLTNLSQVVSETTVPAHSSLAGFDALAIAEDGSIAAVLNDFSVTSLVGLKPDLTQRYRVETQISPFLGARIAAAPGGVAFVAYPDANLSQITILEKYLPSGARSAMRRLTGSARSVMIGSNNLVVVTSIQERNKGYNPQLTWFTP